MTKYQSPIGNVPDEHMRLVGVISTHWEYVEVMLQRAVAEAMKLNYSQVTVLTENISVHAHCDLLMIFARPLEKAEPEAWKQFTTMLAALKAAYGERNKYIHAGWLFPPGELPRRMEVRTRGGKLTSADEPTSEGDLAKAAQQIWEAGLLLLTFGQGRGILMQE
jgi:hypothetical protein